MKKHSEIGKLQNECDKLMQQVGKLKFPKSLVSGKPTQVLHHYFPKSVASIYRYDWNNLIPLTNAEHFEHHTKSNPVIHATVLKIKGQDWHDNLEKHKRDYIKINKEHYIIVKEKLQHELDKIVNSQAECFFPIAK